MLIRASRCPFTPVKNTPSPLTGLLSSPHRSMGSACPSRLLGHPFHPPAGKINLTPQIAGGSWGELTPCSAWSQPRAFVHSLGRLPVGHGCLRRWRGHISVEARGRVETGSVTRYLIYTLHQWNHSDALKWPGLYLEKVIYQGDNRFMVHWFLSCIRALLLHNQHAII